MNEENVLIYSITDFLRLIGMWRFDDFFTIFFQGTIINPTNVRMRPQPEAEMQRQQRQIQHCFESGSVLATLKSWVKVRMLSKSFPEPFYSVYILEKFWNKHLILTLKLIALLMLQIERFFIDCNLMGEPFDVFPIFWKNSLTKASHFCHVDSVNWKVFINNSKFSPGLCFDFDQATFLKFLKILGLQRISKVFSITRTIFSHRRSEQFWQKIPFLPFL